MELDGGLVDLVLVAVGDAGADPDRLVGVARMRAGVVDLHPAAGEHVEPVVLGHDVDLEPGAEALAVAGRHLVVPVRLDPLGGSVEVGHGIAIAGDQFADGPDEVLPGLLGGAGLVPGAGAVGPGSGRDLIDEAAGQKKQQGCRQVFHERSRITTPDGPATKIRYSWPSSTSSRLNLRYSRSRNSSFTRPTPGAYMLRDTIVTGTPSRSIVLVNSTTRQSG